MHRHGICNGRVTAHRASIIEDKIALLLPSLKPNGDGCGACEATAAGPRNGKPCPAAVSFWATEDRKKGDAEEREEEHEQDVVEDEEEQRGSGGAAARGRAPAVARSRAPPLRA